MIDRYSTLEMKEIWSLKAKFNNYLKVELEVLKAYSQLNIIDKNIVDNIIKKAKFDLEKISIYEQKTHHDVIAFIQAVSDNLDQEKVWFHYGLTSSDVIDTAFALQIKEANKILLIKLSKFQETLKKIALAYKELPAIGRTHGIHAEITSFGLRWLNFYDEISREINLFKEAASHLETGKISGAVGNYANLPIEIEEIVCKNLNINYALISSQIISRDRHAYYLSIVALIASTLEKIAVEVRTLHRTELGEILEPFGKKQKGSSAMPHKKNPISSENITGISRLLRSYVTPGYENNVLWNERDISHSSVERVIFPDATNLLDYALTRYNKVLDNLVFNEEKIIDNISFTNGLIFSQKVLNALIEKGMVRMEAYELVQTLTKKSYNDKIAFLEVLKSNQKILSFLNSEELKKLFDYQPFLVNVDKIYQRVLKKNA